MLSSSVIRVTTEVTTESLMWKVYRTREPALRVCSYQVNLDMSKLSQICFEAIKAMDGDTTPKL